MKRILSITLIIAVLFSFASCRNINELNKETTTAVPTTTAAPPVVNEKKQTKEFKDENGRTVYVVDVVLPEISENMEKSMVDYINSVTNKFFEDACVQAEKNIKSAASFMDSSKSDKPWKKTISFETKYISGYYLSFLISESMSYFGSSNNTPSVYARTFSIKEGNPINAAYFTASPETPEIALGYVADLLREKAETDFYEENFALNDVKLAAFDEVASVDDFYLTENGMVFYVSRGDIDPYEPAGIFEAEYSWDELAGRFERPEKY